MLLTVVPTVFAAGGIYMQVRHLGSEMREMRTEMSSHQAEGAHPVAADRLDKLEASQLATTKDQQVMAANVAAICQATGARCR